MSNFSEYRPSLSEIQEHADTKRAESKVKRELAEKKRKIKTRAALAAAGLAATAAIGLGTREAVSDKPNLPDDRFSPNREATGEEPNVDEQIKAAVDGIQRQKSQEEAEKIHHTLTEQEAEKEKARLRDFLENQN